MSEVPMTQTRGPSRPVVDAQHPWLGLLPFQREHREFFFGRDREIAEILDRIQENTLTVLFGRSGLGKSSLLGAGVLPQLEARGCRAVLIRLKYEESSPSLLVQTRQALRAVLPEASWPEDAAEMTLWELFHRRPLVLTDGDPTPVLLLDQFEEIFTLGRETPGREAEAAEWLEQISDLLQNRPPTALEERFASEPGRAREFDFGRCRLRVVFALREDYLSHLEGWKQTLPLLTQNRMALHLLNGPQALEAVVGPGSLAASPLVSRSVAGLIVRTVAEVEEYTPLPQIKAVPPLLSLLCERLNAARLEAGAAEIDAAMVRERSRDILQAFYDEAFAPFPEEHRQAIRQVIEDPPMVTEGGYRNSIVRDDAEAQLRRAGVPDPDAVFDALLQHRIITQDEKDGLQRLEITHDVLVPLVLRSREERKERTAREEAQRKLRAEAAKARVRRTITAGMAVLMALAVAGAIYGFRSASEAKAQRDEARFREGQGWMLRSTVAGERKNQFPETLLYAAHAIGYDGFGRPETAPEDLIRFIDPERNPAEHEDARKRIQEQRAYLPVWSSPRWPAASTALDFSSEGRRIAVGRADGAVQVWDFLGGEKVTTVLEGGGPPVDDVAFHPDARRLDVLADGVWKTWDMEKGEMGEEAAAPGRRLAWSPDGQVAAVAGADGQIHLHSGDPAVPVPSGATGAPATLAYSADASLIVGVWPGSGVRVVFPGAQAASYGWSQLTGAHAATLEEAQRPEFLALVGYAETITAAAPHPDGTILATGSEGGSVGIWEAVGARLIGKCPGDHQHRGAVTALQFRPDGKEFATGSEDGTIRIWRIGADKVPLVVATLGGHEGAVRDLAYDPTGELLATTGSDGGVRLWDVSGEAATAPDLLSYTTGGWYRFDAEDQQALRWVDGQGFVNLPERSLAALWGGGEAGSVPGRLVDSRAWGGVLALGDLGVPVEEAVVKLTERARAAAGRRHWVEVDLLMGWLGRLGADVAGEELRGQRQSGTPDKGRPFTNTTGMNLRWCPPTGPEGFLMGSPDGSVEGTKAEEGRYSYETQHKVNLTHGFWLSQFELTQEEWIDIMGSNPATYKESGLMAPVENVSWREALEFCRRLTDRERARGALPPGWEYSLPSEAQWEYACRAGTTTAYSFGNDRALLHLHGNYNDINTNFSDKDTEHDDRFPYTAPVGSYRDKETKPNAWGFFDMHGNVFEWCADALVPNDADYGPDAASDPLGTQGSHRVSRGGGWGFSPRSCRSAYRSAIPPSSRNSNLGFRPAVVPSSQGAAVAASAVAPEKVSGSEPGVER